MNWIWFHKLGSPKWFFLWSKPFVLPLFFMGGVTFLIGMFWGLAFAPEDYQQGNSFRIIYMHVPAAMLAQSCYLALGSAGLIFLIWKIKISPVFIESVAPIGAVMAFIALITGSIWGKPTWGTWWVWDARLTSVLILFLLFMGIIGLKNALEDDVLANKSISIVGAVGLINLPIIKYSVEWWNTLHQGATFTLTEKPAMPIEMWLPLLISVVGLYCLVLSLVLWRMQAIILERNYRSNWVRKEVMRNGF